MSRVERLSEAIARRVDRRRVLDRAAGTTFAMAAGLAVKSFRTPAVLAQEDHPCNSSTCVNYECGTCYCNPPPGGYCINTSDSYCVGSKCNASAGCSYDYSGYPNTACWCTKDCTHPWGFGHYRCCDCWCPGGLNCGCRQQHTVADSCC
jgi:hypothetical protein